MEDAQARDSYTTGDLKGMLSKPSSSFPATNSSTRSMLDVSSHVSQMNGGNIKRAVSTDSSRHTPVQENGAPNHADQRQSMTHTTKASPNDERMEGIRYRFEDRVSKVNSDVGSTRSTPAPPGREISESAESEDVEMANADDTASLSATPSNNVSRAETPLSGDERRVNPANGSVKPRPGNVAPSVRQPLRKRPAPDIFMPRKQTKPKPK